ncbi:hypothetical protein [Uliginosibacterium sediminicola]|uniref:MetA-pathway of phenol degradation n=1 Tax=Uliginosibacterium sediminicola TaxID=2024550 RepID=A0ABU9Z1S8_9RHOO
MNAIHQSRLRLEMRHLPLCLALLLPGTSAWAGAWTLSAGMTDTLLSSTISSSEHYFDADHKIIKGERYSKKEFQLRLEHGMSDTTTVIVAPTYMRTRAGGSAGGSYNGMGYSELGLRQRVYIDDANVFSLQGVLRAAGARDSDNAAELGNTDHEYDLRALYGRNLQFGSWPAFANIELAWRIRSGSPPDEHRVDLTLGLKPSPQWLITLQSFSVYSDGTGQGAFTAPYYYHKAQAGLTWRFLPAWSAGVNALTTYAGKNAWREQGVVATLGHQF